MFIEIACECPIDCINIHEICTERCCCRLFLEPLQVGHTASYRPFRCELSPRSESIKNRCYAHYRLKIDVTPPLYRLHPLVGKSYRRPIPVTQIRADLRRQQSSATAKSCHPESCLDWVSQSTVFYAVALLCWHLRSARICVTAIGRR